MTKHMQWEASVTADDGKAITTKSVKFTDEAKERLTINVPKLWEHNRPYTPPDFSRIPTADRWLIAGIFGIMGCLLGALVLVVMYLVWAELPGVP